MRRAEEAAKKDSVEVVDLSGEEAEGGSNGSSPGSVAAANGMRPPARKRTPKRVWSPSRSEGENGGTSVRASGGGESPALTPPPLKRRKGRPPEKKRRRASSVQQHHQAVPPPRETEQFPEPGGEYVEAGRKEEEAALTFEAVQCHKEVRVSVQKLSPEWGDPERLEMK